MRRPGLIPAISIAVAVLGILGALNSYQTSATLAESSPDPFRAAAAETRFEQVMAHTEPGTVLAYISDMPVSEDRGAAAFLAAQNALAPRALVDPSAQPDFAVGNFSKPGDFPRPAPPSATKLSKTSETVSCCTAGGARDRSARDHCDDPARLAGRAFPCGGIVSGHSNRARGIVWTWNRIHRSLCDAGRGRRAPLLARNGLLALTGLTAWLAYRFRAMPSPSSGTSGGLNWLLGIAAAICLAAVISGFYATSTASPDGDWDAFAIWNVRAHYLAGGEATWHRALAPDLGAKMLGASHPGYPLLLSGFVGAAWILGGVTNSPAPVAASLLFSLVIVALLGGALFRARGLGLALLACIILLSSEVFAAQTAEQYSDLPLACCFLAALALLDHAQSEGSPGLFAAAGFAAGLAPWAKNEGWPFAIAFLFLVLWRCGAGKAKWALMGSLPGLLAALSVKLLVKVGEGMFPSTLSAAVSKIADPSRWSQTIAAFLQAIWRMGVPWAHPLLLIAAVGLVCGFIPGTQRLAKTWLLIPLAAVFAADLESSSSPLRISSGTSRPRWTGWWPSYGPRRCL